MKALLDGKGANLAEMSAIGLPIPPDFTLPPGICDYCNNYGGEWSDGLEEQVRESVRHLEELMDPATPQSHC